MSVNIIRKCFRDATEEVIKKNQMIERDNDNPLMDMTNTDVNYQLQQETKPANSRVSKL